MTDEFKMFGVYQKQIEDAIERNGKSFAGLKVYAMTGDTKGFKMIFDVKWGMSVQFRIEECIEESTGKKSKTSITVKLDEKNNELEPFHDVRTFNELCSELLFKVLFEKNYKFGYAFLMLPEIGKFGDREAGDNQIKTLEIDVANDEKDKNIVNSWLSKFKNGVQKIDIISKVTRIVLTTNSCLQKSVGVEIFGYITFDPAFIISLQGKYFVHSGPSTEAFTCEQMKELTAHCKNLEKVKAISLKQSDRTNGTNLVRWMADNRSYGSENKVNDGYYIKEDAKGGIRFFSVVVHAQDVQIGKFVTRNQAQESSTKWPETYNDQEFVGIS